MCTHVRAGYVKLLASCIDSLATVAKQSVGMFNFAQ